MGNAVSFLRSANPPAAADNLSEVSTEVGSTASTPRLLGSNFLGPSDDATWNASPSESPRATRQPGVVSANQAPAQPDASQAAPGHARPVVIPNREIAQAQSASAHASRSGNGLAAAAGAGVLAAGGAAVMGLGIATALGKGMIAAHIDRSEPAWEEGSTQNMVGAFMVLGGLAAMIPAAAVIGGRRRAPLAAPTPTSSVELPPTSSNV
jgi:hypothetical protein